MPATPKNTAVSIRARLLNYSKQSGENYQRVLTRYAIERLLFRLGQTEATKHYVLKGAMLFVTWPEHVFRPTSDLDLLGCGNPSPETIAELFGHVCQVTCAEDGLLFHADSLKIQPVREADKYQGVRLSVHAELAKAVITVPIDIGFGDYIYPVPQRQTFPALLPGMPEARILMYPPETVIAEKFEALLRFGIENGRAKDFHDLWVVIHTFRFDLATLATAISGTLQRRETIMPQGTPVGLSNDYASVAEHRGLWSGFLRRNPPLLHPPAFPELLAELRHFFAPVISALPEPEFAWGQWNPVKQVWGDTSRQSSPSEL